MKSLILLAHIMLAISCGTIEEMNVHQPSEETIERIGDSRREIVVEYRKQNGTYALTVSSSGDMPECSKANDRQLVYVKDEAIFFSCDEGTWIEIDLKGEPGPAGPKGETGDKGEAAISISNGWIDPVSGQQWIIGGTAMLSQAMAACSSPWRLPTAEEALQAGLRGIKTAVDQLKAPIQFWTSTTFISSTDILSYQYMLLNGNSLSSVTDVGSLTKFGAFCTR